MEEKYPEEYLTSCSHEILHILMDNTDDVLVSAVNYFLDLEENTKDMWPILAIDCTREVLNLTRNQPKYMKENAINFMVMVGRCKINEEELKL